jgi:adenosylmethionine-8-amino-7-oxononanoate aminotransferase
MTEKPHHSDSGTVALDARHVWHPFTQAEGAPEPIEIVAGEGAWLRAADGRRFLDLISSWWVNVHGHAHPAIAAAIARQAQTLEHVIFADFTHRPAAELAARLTAMAPDGLSRVFFSDNGSTAVEVALKLAVQYWRNRGEPARHGFVALSGGYHGDTVGAMSVGSAAGFATPFADLLFKSEFLPFPDTWDGDNEAAEKEDEALAAAAKFFDAEGSRTAALIIEPLIQGAGGMRMCRPRFVQELTRLARSKDILVICDEVMTGFGRTGEMFASGKAEIEPDMICLSKGLTGGFMPLGATLCRESVFAAFRGDGVARAFAHGHSYTANPLGCAAALASLDLFEDGAWHARAEAISARHRAFLDRLAGHPKVSRRRLMGTIAAFDVGAEGGYSAAIGPVLKRAFLDRGLLLRPLGNVVYLMPPYCIDDADLDHAYAEIAAVLDRIEI